MVNTAPLAPLLLAVAVQAGKQLNGYRPCSDFPEYQFHAAWIPATLDMDTYPSSHTYSIQCGMGNASLSSSLVATALYVANPRFSAFSNASVEPLLTTAGCTFYWDKEPLLVPAMEGIVPDVTLVNRTSATTCEFHLDGSKSNNFWTHRGCPWELTGCRFVFFGTGKHSYDVFECTVDKPLQTTQAQLTSSSLSVYHSFPDARTSALNCVVEGSAVSLTERDWALNWYWFPNYQSPSEENRREMREFPGDVETSVDKSSDLGGHGLCRSRWVLKIKMRPRPEAEGSQFQCWLTSWDGQSRHKSDLLTLD